MTVLRKAAIGLALCGAAVAGYLACVQLNLIHGPWDPVFGAASSHQVLHSRFAEALPFPDALAGAIVYAVEAGLAIAVSRSTQQTWRVLYVVVVLGMAAGGLALLGLQAAFIHHFCLLCLTSAAISWVIAVIMAADAITSLTTKDPSHETSAVRTNRAGGMFKMRHQPTGANSKTYGYEGGDN